MTSALTRKDRLWSDVGIIIVSIFVAVQLVESGILEKILATTEGLGFLESFVGGMFFTSAFTTAPAMVALGTIALKNTVFWTAFFGAFGALMTDLLIFRFIKDGLKEDLSRLIGKGLRAQLRHVFATKLFRWLTPFLAALIIASPLPDELAVVLMGFTDMRIKLFIPFSFLSNFIGIFVIGLVAQAIGS